MRGGRVLIRIERNSFISIGNRVTFNNSTRKNFVGINKPSSIAVGDNAKLVIGNNSGFSGVSIYCSLKIKIGNYCNIGGNVSIWDWDFHPMDYLDRRNSEIRKIKSEPITINDDVFIGANSIILKGVTIGKNSIIGAGSVVTREIPENEIWGGNPARFIKKIVY
jgi:acetyltransferase-like isoleucine patch superfamily enzyme